MRFVGSFAAVSGVCYWLPIIGHLNVFQAGCSSLEVEEDRDLEPQG